MAQLNRLAMEKSNYIRRTVMNSRSMIYIELCPGISFSITHKALNATNCLLKPFRQKRHKR